MLNTNLKTLNPFEFPDLPRIPTVLHLAEANILFKPIVFKEGVNRFVRGKETSMLLLMRMAKRGV
jgi:hypothetical protein